MIATINQFPSDSVGGEGGVEIVSPWVTGKVGRISF